MIHSDHIRSQLFHELSVSLTLGGILAQVNRVELVGDTLDEPLVSIRCEELGSLLCDLGKSGDGSTECCDGIDSAKDEADHVARVLPRDAKRVVSSARKLKDEMKRCKIASRVAPK